MIKLNIDGHLICIPDALLADAVTANIPKFLTGAESAQGKNALLKAGIKGIVPMILGMLHKGIRDSNSTLEPPDIKCAEARDNIITYTCRYLTRAGLAEANDHIFSAEGTTDEQGNYIVSGITSRSAAMVH